MLARAITMLGGDAFVKRRDAIHAATQKCKWSVCFESVLIEARAPCVARDHELFEPQTKRAPLEVNQTFMSACATRRGAHRHPRAGVHRETAGIRSSSNRPPRGPS